MMLKTHILCLRKKLCSDVQIDGVNCQKYYPLVRNWACIIYESNLNLLFVVTEQKIFNHPKCMKCMKNPLKLCKLFF